MHYNSFEINISTNPHSQKANRAHNLFMRICFAGDVVLNSGAQCVRVANIYLINYNEDVCGEIMNYYYQCDVRQIYGSCCSAIARAWSTKEIVFIKQIANSIILADGNTLLCIRVG